MHHSLIRIVLTNSGFHIDNTRTKKTLTNVMNNNKIICCHKYVLLLCLLYDYFIFCINIVLHFILYILYLANLIMYFPCMTLCIFCCFLLVLLFVIANGDPNKLK